MAITIGQDDKKILLIDCDMRKPVIHRRFSLLNASIGEFSAVPGGLKLERWGDTHHLEPFGAEDDW